MITGIVLSVKIQVINILERDPELLNPILKKEFTENDKASASERSVSLNKLNQRIAECLNLLIYCSQHLYYDFQDKFLPL
jgi:hypothetical protein